MSHEQEPQMRQEPLPISRDTFFLLLELLPFTEYTEALLARISYGESNNLHIEFLFDGMNLSVVLSEKPSMMFKPRRRKK